MRDVWKYYDAATGKFIVDRWNGRYLRSESFDYFRDFYSNLNGDLSDSYLFEYNPSKRKIEKYGISPRSLGSDYLISIGAYDDSFRSEIVSGIADLNEIVSTQDTNVAAIESTDSTVDFHSNVILYISDLHLDHKIVKKFSEHGSHEEIEFYIYRVVRSLYDDFNYFTALNKYLLICGDVSHSIQILDMFYGDLSSMINPACILTVIGNHEVWTSDLCSEPLSTYQNYVSYFRHYFKSLGITMLENDLFVVKNEGRYILNESEINSMSPAEIEDFCRGSSLRIFGTTGYSGLNPDHNATTGIYRGRINRAAEIALSKKASDSYNKVNASLENSEVVVLSHMPLGDWCDSGYEPGRFYVSGHTHNNIRLEDDGLKVYSDNQTGYSGEYFHLKHFLTSGKYDPFENLNDGIYLINRLQYLDFYYGHGMSINFNDICDIIMLKRNGFYLFLCQKDKLYFLDGGRKLVAKHPMEYYYSKMILYANQTLAAIKPFNDYLEEVSECIKSVGGRGSIHGCIVDIDFNNHVYVNPFDGSITAYWASDMKNKVKYASVKNLLRAKRPELLSRCGSDVNKLDAIATGSRSVDLPIHVSDTSMYRPSRQMEKYRHLQINNVIRVWNDELPLSSDFLLDGDEVIPATISLIPDNGSKAKTMSGTLRIIRGELEETYAWVMFKKDVKKTLTGEDILCKDPDLYIRKAYIQYYPQRKKLSAGLIYSLLAEIKGDDRVS